VQIKHRLGIEKKVKKKKIISVSYVKLLIKNFVVR
jgi:hypothetical protein